MKKAIQLISFFLCILILSVSISSQKIETVDGVRTVHNPKKGKWGKDLPITISLIRTIGDINTLDENRAFNNPSDIVVDKTGHIYILDSGNNRIQKFDSQGNYLSTLGRSGQGPGEFNWPSSFDMDDQGLLYITDQNNRRIQVLDSEGTYQKMIRFTDPIYIIDLLSSGLVATKANLGLSIYGDEDQELPPLIRLIDQEGQINHEFGKMFDYKHQLLNRTGNFFYFFIDENDFIYLTFSYQNRIEKYSSEGKLLWKADRELNYTSKPIDKGKVEATATSRSYQAPRMNKCSGGVAVDSKSRIWIVTLNRQIKEEENVYMITTGNSSGQTRKIIGNTDLQETDMYVLEIFDDSGILLGNISLNHFVDDIYINHNQLFLLDQMRGVKFYQYNIIE